MNLSHTEKEAAQTLINLALQEDVGNGDITTDNLIPASERRNEIGRASWRGRV